MTKDMTHGSPVKLILGFALPLLAGMLFQQLYNLVDAIKSAIALNISTFVIFSTAIINSPFQTVHFLFLFLLCIYYIIFF